MKNLAGVEDCDVSILSELALAGIPIKEVVRSTGEVPYSYVGVLGEFKFRRAWYYWVVEGRVPLRLANIMYEDKIGRTDVRVAGHCGCPPPYEWASWFTPDDKIVVKTKEQVEYIRFIEKGIISESVLDDIVFSDEPWKIAEGFIETYHIDSQAGLNLFTNTIKSIL